jgi:hypothetical protein
MALHSRKAAQIAAAFGLAVTATLAFAGAASAAPPGDTCDSTLAPGSYQFHSLTVTGDCVIPAGTVSVTGGLSIQPGASLTAFQPDVTVRGGVHVGEGATLNLGCSEAMVDDPFISFLCPEGHASSVTISGGIMADAPLTMNLDGIVVNGGVTSAGGGPGPQGEFLNFSFKDNLVHGSVSLTGWSGGWMGMIRNAVSGNVSYSDNSGTDPDTNEIVHNAVGGQLACFNNDHVAQFGDAGAPPYAWNTVHGQALGECATLVP